MELEALWKSHAPRLLAALVQRFKQLQLAEDALACAFEQALRWPLSGQPSDPVAWLYQSAVHAAIDQLRREQRFRQGEPEASFEPIPDERLAMFFLCAHPALSTDAQAMLMLRFCAGVPLPQIARWFDQSESAVQRRLHRAKRKLEQSGARFELPERTQWPERLPPVLSALEIMYDQSYSNVAGGIEQDGFAREAEQLALQLASQIPEPEVLGLAALIVLAESRRGARIDADGAMIPLDQQDPQRWDSLRIATAAKLLRTAARFVQPGRYQLRALISAQHARRKQLGQTPWVEICQLYQRLVAIDLDETPALWINQALALAGRDGPAAGLQRLQAFDANWALSKLAPHQQIARALAYAHLFELTHDLANAHDWRKCALQLDGAQPSRILGRAERAWIERKLRSQ